MRRKNEMSYRTVDREWPHQVAVPAERTRQRIFDEVMPFCAGFSMSPRSQSVRHDGIDYNIWCFADPEHARLFKEHFGGLDFNPKDRGKGKNWRTWNRPPAAGQNVG